MCVSMTRGHWKPRTEICGRNDLIQIRGFHLHIPAKTPHPFCDTASAKFHYNSTIDISCLMKFSKKEAKILLETIMEAFSGKAASEVNSSHVMDEFISNKLFGLPDFSLLDLDYTCFNSKSSSMYSKMYWHVYHTVCILNYVVFKCKSHRVCPEVFMFQKYTIWHVSWNVHVSTVSHTTCVLNYRCFNNKSHSVCPELCMFHQ